jgi:hypothetical protein
MLNKDTMDYIKSSIKEINREKDIDARLEKMILVKDEIRNKLNDELDDLFSTINLKRLKVNLEE